MKLQTKMPLLVIAPAIIIVAVFLATLSISDHQKSDGALINIAGRQRMLSQKIIGDALNWAVLEGRKADSSAAKTALIDDRRLFDVTLKALLGGDKLPETPGSNGPTLSCPPPSDTVRAKLQAVEKVWGSFQSVLNEALKDNFQHDHDQAEVVKLGGELLKAANEVVTVMQTESDDRVKQLLFVQAGGVLLGVLLSVFSLLTVSMILKKMTMIRNVMQSYSQGDLTQRASVTDIKDELDETVAAANKLGDSMASIVGEMRGANSLLINAADQFATGFRTMAATTDSMRTRSETVAAASEEASASLITVSSRADEMSDVIRGVATAMEEMSASINEVARSCQTESQATTAAGDKVQTATQVMQQLDQTAREIGRIVDLIRNVADKTNLLALNATIEAATAGEAGKGFAVVANEVKELARQTAKATEEIRTQIESMQKSAATATAATRDIAEVIGQVADISHTIAAAIEEQSITANEIARNIATGATGASEIARNVTEAATGNSEVSRTIHDLYTDNREVADAVAGLTSKTGELATLSRGLYNAIQTFKFGEKLVVWNASYCVGIEDIDRQHQVLCDLINELNICLNQGRGREVLGTVLHRLNDYVVTHFAHEERLLTEHSYPEFDGHHKIHVTFINKIKAVQDDFTAGKAMVSGDLLTFLKDWLIDHICKTDKRYAPFLQSKGVR